MSYVKKIRLVYEQCDESILCRLIQYTIGNNCRVNVFIEAEF